MSIEKHVLLGPEHKKIEESCCANKTIKNL